MYAVFEGLEVVIVETLDIPLIHITAAVPEIVMHTCFHEFAVATLA